MTTINLSSSRLLVIETFQGRSKHGPFPGIRIRVGGKSKQTVVASFHASRALAIADALRDAFQAAPFDDDGFFSSRAWQYTRYGILKRDGFRCQVCGATAKDGATLHVDHIRPRSKFPELALDLDNLRACCASCNLGKGARDESNDERAIEETAND